MRLPLQEHRRQPFRVHALARDFDLLDVWSVPFEADAAKGETFERFAAMVWERGLALASEGGLSGALFRIRFAVGRWLGWDRSDAPLAIPGCDETTVGTRLSSEDHARNRGRPAARSNSPEAFTLIYRFEDEMLLELSNKTIHALVHFGWVELENGKHSPRIAVYVKSRGRWSDLYMGAIAPFRHRIVYPRWTRNLARACV